MNYTFTISGKKTCVFFNDYEDSTRGTSGHVSFWLDKNSEHKEYIRSVRKDIDGRLFFTWNKKRYYMDEFQCSTPKQLVEELTSGKAHGQNLCNTLQKYGLDSLIVSIRTKKLSRFNIGDFCLAFEVSSNLDRPEDFDWVDYKFIPEYLCMPQDGYKLRLVPASEEDRDVYPSKRYYVDDLCGLIARCDDFKVKLP